MAKKKESSSEKAHAPVIVRRRVHASHGGHHGGAWKVAYADFVTAMMAFFLLMWLLGATTEDQRKGIADYFATKIPISPVSAGGDGVLDGGFVPRPAEREFRLGDRDVDGVSLAGGAPDPQDSSSATLQARHADLIERQRFETIQSEILRRIEQSEELRDLSGNLLFEITPEGLRIQIYDRSGRAMFPSSSAIPHAHTVAILHMIAEIVGAVRNGIVVTGHTDGRPFAGSGTYGNWDLSADRANAARRVLTAGGVVPQRFRRIEGRAELDPLIAGAPDDPRNRRIAITLLRTVAGARASGAGDGQRLR